MRPGRGETSMAAMNPLKTLLVAAALAVVGAAPAHAAQDATDYYLESGSFISITDHEPFGANVKKSFSFDNYQLGRVSGKTTKTFKISRCVGGEVRVDVVFEVKRFRADVSDVSANAYLFEGSSCNTSDMDGTAFSWWHRLWIPGFMVPLSMTVKNTDEGGDWAWMSLPVQGKPVA
jgi:hypothetical protein